MTGITFNKTLSMATDVTQKGSFIKYCIIPPTVGVVCQVAVWIKQHYLFKTNELFNLLRIIGIINLVLSPICLVYVIYYIVKVERKNKLINFVFMINLLWFIYLIFGLFLVFTFPRPGIG